jgi:hypothetical protein
MEKTHPLLALALVLALLLVCFTSFLVGIRGFACTDTEQIVCGLDPVMTFTLAIPITSCSCKELPDEKN